MKLFILYRVDECPDIWVLLLNALVESTKTDVCTTAYRLSQRSGKHGRRTAKARTYIESQLCTVFELSTFSLSTFFHVDILLFDIFWSTFLLWTFTLSTFSHLAIQIDYEVEEKRFLYHIATSRVV